MTSSGRGPWWREGVVYQVYPRSWADSNDDGIGDLPGIIDRLGYLEWLGVDALWLNPVTPSPNEDWGYDVADFCDVDPVFGSLTDLGALVNEAARRGIAVVLDLVPNHTSDRHSWFRDALSSRAARHRDWYVWRDPRPDGSPPNNWLSAFGKGSAWTLDEASGQYYLHNFLPSQPDLNWWNPEVRAAFDDILRFWFDRGIAGLRIDVAHGIVKDQELRDNLPVSEDDHPQIKRLGQRHVYNMNRPEVHDVLRHWRGIARRYHPERVLMGETWVLDVERMAAFYGSGEDELHLAFNFPFIFSPFVAEELREIVELTESVLPPGARPAWTASNHDVGRFPTRWCDDQPAAVRCALVLLLTLRGTPILYYGDEIGMPETPLRLEEIRDPVGLAHWPENPGRDPGRTPMHWHSRPGAGFTSPSVRPWLPVGDHATCNVEDQRGDPASTLHLCRDLIALRRRCPDLTSGSYSSLGTSDGVWAWRRGRSIAVTLNLSDRPARVPAQGVIEMCTARDRDGEKVTGGLALAPWEGAIVMGGR